MLENTLRLFEVTGMTVDTAQGLGLSVAPIKVAVLLDGLSGLKRVIKDVDRGFGVVRLAEIARKYPTRSGLHDGDLRFLESESNGLEKRVRIGFWKGGIKLDRGDVTGRAFGRSGKSRMMGV